MKKHSRAAKAAIYAVLSVMTVLFAAPIVIVIMNQVITKPDRYTDQYNAKQAQHNGEDGDPRRMHCFFVG